MLGLTNKENRLIQRADGRKLQNWRSHPLVALISLPATSCGEYHSVREIICEILFRRKAYVGAILAQNLVGQRPKILAERSRPTSGQAVQHSRAP